MTLFEPVVRLGTVTVRDAPPGAPAACCNRLQELDRIPLSRGANPDPARLLEDFAAGYRLPVRDPARPGRHDPTATVCGAAVLLPADACAGATPAGSARSPAPAVPISSR
jgi:hypothetical protein